MQAPPDLNALSLPELYSTLASNDHITRLLELARDEDLGRIGDITTLACFSEQARHSEIKARLIARTGATIAGLPALKDLADVLGVRLNFEFTISDGDCVNAGDVVARITGRLADLLAYERTALNLLARLSGVATLTRAYLARMRSDAPGTDAKILDTRKTTPGWRLLEKYAVRCGGGDCHRIGLHDAILIKDNHLSGVAVDSIAQFVRTASETARSRWQTSFVEVEVDTLAQFAALLTLDPSPIDIVLLDNMTPSMLADAVAMRIRSGQRLLLEASGGITIDTIGAVARSGVDRISIGALTHQAVSVDFALDF